MITQFKQSKLLFLMMGMLLLLCFLTTGSTSAQSGPPFTDADYALALDYSNMFYEAQRAGDTDDPRYMERRVDWRVPNLLDDGSDVGRDLTGGWFDAGDHVKFHLPMSYSAGVLGMGVVLFEDAYKHSGTYDRALDNLRWVNDYFIKANPAPGEFYTQVADGFDDHDYWWGPPELIGQPGLNYPMPRKSFELSETGGGGILGATAGSLAQASIVFRRAGETAYADELLDAAEVYYEEALRQPNTWGGQGFYGSSNYTDDWFMGAISLYWAMEEKSSGTGSGYLSGAQSHYGGLADGIGGWMMDWDNNQYPAVLLLAMATGDSSHQAKVELSIENAINGVLGSYTPGGMWYFQEWGSARYPSNVSFLALSWAKHLEDTGSSSPKIQQYRDWSKGQIDYILGDNVNSYSYMVGFGTNGATLPHHRGAHLSAADGTYPGNDYNGWSVEDAGPNRNILYGALASGPDTSDNHNDSRNDYISNEVATDYNSGFQGAIAGMYDMIVQPDAQPVVTLVPTDTPTPCPGGSCPTPVTPTNTPTPTPTDTPTNTPPPPTADPSAALLVEASVTTSDNQSDYRTLVTNQGSSSISDASIRIFFRVDDGVSANDVLFEVDYSNVGATASAPIAWQDDLYYIELSIADTLQPNDSGAVNGRLHLSNYGSEFDGDNDPATDGLTNSQAQTQSIPIYISGSYVSGIEPGSVPLEPQVTDTPDPTDTPTVEIIENTPTPTPQTDTPLAVGTSRQANVPATILPVVGGLLFTGLCAAVALNWKRD